MTQLLWNHPLPLSTHIKKPPCWIFWRLYSHPPLKRTSQVDSPPKTLGPEVARLENCPPTHSPSFHSSIQPRERCGLGGGVGRFGLWMGCVPGKLGTTSQRGGPGMWWKKLPALVQMGRASSRVFFARITHHLQLFSMQKDIEPRSREHASRSLSRVQRSVISGRCSFVNRFPKVLFYEPIPKGLWTKQDVRFQRNQFNGIWWLV